MELVEAGQSLLVVARTSASHREALRALLDYFRLHDIEFRIGGARPDTVLTLSPMPPDRRDDLRRWWAMQMTPGGETPSLERD